MWARNGEASTIPNGSVVRMSGAQGNKPLVYLSDNRNESANYTIGLATEDIATDGYVTTFGLVHEVNTQGITEGLPIFVGTGGLFTAIPPSPPNHVVRVGFVLYSHSQHGIVFVTPHVRNELGQLCDVVITNPLSGDILTYNSNSGIWQNQPLTMTGYATSSQLNALSGLLTGHDLTFTTTLNSGVESQNITYPVTLTGKPSAIACEIENNVDNLIYSHVILGVTNSGFTVSFSDNLSSTGYTLYTTVTI